MSMILGLYEQRIDQKATPVKTRRAEQGVLHLLAEHPMIWDADGVIAKAMNAYWDTPPCFGTVENKEYRRGRDAVLSELNHICGAWPKTVKSPRELVTLDMRLIPLPPTDSELPSRARVVWVDNDQTVFAHSYLEAERIVNDLERSLVARAKEAFGPKETLLGRFGRLLKLELAAANRKDDDLLKRKLGRGIFDAEDLLGVATLITPVLVNKVQEIGFAKTARALRDAA